MTKVEYPSVSEIASYYDEDAVRRVRGFLKGNKRVNAAIRFLKTYSHRFSGRHLDVGCGIGAIAAECRKFNPDCRVVAVDISPKNIELANLLFQDQEIDFGLSDMTSPPDGGPFNVITMVDVYEHIRKSDRHSVQRTLSDSLTEDGLLLLTVPSPFHQQFLEQHEPDALQVVDETVALECVTELAEAVGGTVVYFAFVPVWMQHQYIHIAIDRRPVYAPVEKRRHDADADGVLVRIARKLTANREQVYADRKKLIQGKLGAEMLRHIEA